MLNKQQRIALKRKARDLFNNGLKYADISAQLKVNKSTISGWCSDLAKIRLKNKMEDTKNRKAKEKEIRSKLRIANIKSKPCLPPFKGFVRYTKFSEDGRVRYHLYNKKTKVSRFMLRSRYRMAVKLGRELLETEHVDHYDEDKTNDKIDNLQILTPEENSLKSARFRHPKKPRLCVICKKEFEHKRLRITCSEECKLKRMSNSHKGKVYSNTNKIETYTDDIMKLYNKGLSSYKIEKKLAKLGAKISRSTINRRINENLQSV